LRVSYSVKSHLAFAFTVNASSNTEPQIFCGTLYQIKSSNCYIAATFQQLLFSKYYLRLGNIPDVHFINIHSLYLNWNNRNMRKDTKPPQYEILYMNFMIWQFSLYLSENKVSSFATVSLQYWKCMPNKRNSFLLLSFYAYILCIIYKIIWEQNRNNIIDGHYYQRIKEILN
jgi:hypothetical protein